MFIRYMQFQSKFLYNQYNISCNDSQQNTHTQEKNIKFIFDEYLYFLRSKEKNIKINIVDRTYRRYTSHISIFTAKRNNHYILITWHRNCIKFPPVNFLREQRANNDGTMYHQKINLHFKNVLVFFVYFQDSLSEIFEDQEFQ